MTEKTSKRCLHLGFPSGSSSLPPLLVSSLNFGRCLHSYYENIRLCTTMHTPQTEVEIYVLLLDVTPECE